MLKSRSSEHWRTVEKCELENWGADILSLCASNSNRSLVRITARFPFSRHGDGRWFPAGDLASNVSTDDSLCHASSIRRRYVLATSGGDQLLERVDIPAVIPWLVDGCFRDERSVGQAEVIQQQLERLLTDHSFSDMFMPVEL